MTDAELIERVREKACSRMFQRIIGSRIRHLLICALLTHATGCGECEDPGRHVGASDTVRLSETGSGYESINITAELVLASSDYPTSAAFEMYITPSSHSGNAQSLVVTVADLVTGESTVHDLGDALLGSGASLYWSSLCRGMDGCDPFRYEVDVATDTGEALFVQFQAYAELPVCEAIDGDFSLDLELLQ